MVLNLLATTSYAQNLRRLENPNDKEEEKQKTGLSLERFYYEDFIFSQARKVQLGDQTELEASLLYRYDENTYGRLRFETVPEENRFDNKTSRFELLVGHEYGQVEFTLDFVLESDEADDGGTSLGFDIDSEYTALQWHINKNVDLIFYPFNFDGEVGQEFNTRDVTRLFFIEGLPTNVIFTQGENAVGEKTIPGFVFDYHVGSWSAYAGIGAATYLSPTNDNFDIIDNRNAERWERGSDIGYKFGFNQRVKGKRELRFEAVGHTKARETGALLESAASLFYIERFAMNSSESERNAIVEFELTGTKAGDRPWRVSRTENWFERTTVPGFDPVYADLNRNLHEWIGKTDFAASLRLGIEFPKDKTIYSFLRYQGKHFIFRDEESAHVLRTADESQSHGGLLRGGAGMILRYGKFAVTPEVEYRRARNPVFSNTEEVELADRLLANFRKTDFLFTLFLTYDLEGTTVLLP